MSSQLDDVPEILSALEPYLSDIVLIGGWVPELYRRFGGLSWEGRLSRTTEFDLLLTSPLPPLHRPKLREILERAGLRSARDEAFPAVWVDADDEHTVIEFLMLDLGPAKGDKVRPVYEQGSLGAVAMRDVDLLLEFTNKLDVLVNGTHLRVLVPSLGAYVLSKGLSFGGRPPHAEQSTQQDKRAKDLVYLHDVIMAGATARARVKSDLAVISQSAKYSAVSRRAAECLKPIVHSAAEKLLDEAGEILASRERLSKPVAIMRIRGTVIELCEIVDDIFGAK